MEQQTNYIVFQCYGNEGIFNECLFALLSLSRQYPEGLPAGMQVWIYTDNPAWFATFLNIGIALNFRKLDNELLARWRGTIDFVHRIKIEILKDFTKERNGNVLYADTDVVFRAPVTEMMRQINQGQLYMHVMEGIVSDCGNPILEKLDTHLRESSQMKINGRPLWDLPMWNAGVLGFNTQYRELLDDALAFTDTEYPQFPKHIVEQFAFSIFFRQAGAIKTAAPYLLHYWNMKEARLTLASFFAFFKTKAWDELTHYSSLIQMHVLLQEKLNFYQNRSIADKLLHKQWQPVEYDWKEMMTQL
jgi:hypothetical protein